MLNKRTEALFLYTLPLSIRKEIDDFLPTMYPVLFDNENSDNDEVRMALQIVSDVNVLKFFEKDEEYVEGIKNGFFTDKDLFDFFQNRKINFDVSKNVIFELVESIFGKFVDAEYTLRTIQVSDKLLIEVNIAISKLTVRQKELILNYFPERQSTFPMNERTTLKITFSKKN